MKKILWTGLWLLSLGFSAYAYEIDWNVFVITGGEARGGSWGMVSSLGSPVCGKSEGGGYCETGNYIAVSGLQQTGSITLQAMVVSSAMVRLTWNDLTDEQYYSLSRDGIAIASWLPCNTTFYQDTFQLKAKTQYLYEITAYKGTESVKGTATVITPESKDNFIPYHNLFHPAEGEKVSIYYKIENACPVTIKLYNLAGELVRTLLDENKSQGQYWIDWDGKNDDKDRKSVV